MKHLNWHEILDYLEQGKRPSHLDNCPDCEAKWETAREMFSAMAPDEGQSFDLEKIGQRILSGAQERRAWWTLFFPKFRLAFAALLILCLVGSPILWQRHQSNMEQQYVAILAGDLVASTAGLDFLLPKESFSEWMQWTEDLAIMTHEGNANYLIKEDDYDETMDNNNLHGFHGFDDAWNCAGGRTGDVQAS